MRLNSCFFVMKKVIMWIYAICVLLWLLIMVWRVYRRKKLSTSSSVRLLLALKFPTVFSAFFASCEYKWLIFNPSDVSGCSSSKVWKRGSYVRIFSFLPSKNNVFIVVHLSNADVICGHCWDAKLSIASESLLIGLLLTEFRLRGVCPTNGNVLWGERCVAMFCGRVDYCANGLFSVVIRPVRSSRFLFCGALCPITMSWASARRSKLVPTAGL